MPNPNDPLNERRNRGLSPNIGFWGFLSIHIKDFLTIAVLVFLVVTIVTRDNILTVETKKQLYMVMALCAGLAFGRKV